MGEDEIKARLDAKGMPRITRESIHEKIVRVDYIYHGCATICLLEMKNGFIAYGFSACASPENYDKDIGQHYAYEDAFRSLWPLEGYLLREKLSERGK